MITIIHGDDVGASRTFLATLKGQAVSPVELMGESIDITELTQVLDGGGLFGDEKFIIIERLLTSKKVTEIKPVIELLIKYSEENTIVIWENKELTKATLQKLPKASVKLYKLPQTLFQLIDNLRPDNTRQLVNLYHSTRTGVEDELILYMLARQVRLLLAVKTGADISEMKSVSWQMSKLEKQSRLFSTDELSHLHDEIYEIERKMKTGDSVHTTGVLIDFLLFKI